MLTEMGYPQFLQVATAGAYAMRCKFNDATVDGLVAALRDSGWDIVSDPAIFNRLSQESNDVFEWSARSRGSTIEIYTADDGFVVCGVSSDQRQCAFTSIPADDKPEGPDDVATATKESFRCLGRAAALRSAAGVAVSLAPQTRLEFMWEGASTHPLQAAENFYQHEAAEKELADPPNARENQSQVVQGAFFMGHAEARCFDPEAKLPECMHPLASVRANHLIDSFYLYRLLVAYRVTSDRAISENQRNLVSSALTSLLHDRERMEWLGAWLAQAIAKLGSLVGALNEGYDKPRVIFFLKGGRALNYWLGTPQGGENDWDTQVVIDPFLPQAEWYSMYRRVHNLLVVTLCEFQADFTRLVGEHVEAFKAYAETLDDVQNGDSGAGSEHASCKAELIDIGIPRRDQPAAQEEWSHLSARGALCDTDGVVFPTRNYYFNEYLSMIREAFRPGGNVVKAPKRIARFVQVLGHNAIDLVGVRNRLRVELPLSVACTDKLGNAAKEEILLALGSQFVDGYHLRLDRGILGLFDTEFTRLVDNPPDLPDALPVAANQPDGAAARCAYLGTHLSAWMKNRIDERATWIAEETETAALVDRLRALNQCLAEPVAAVGGQVALAGGFALYLHSRQLRYTPPGMEPLWRAVLKVQLPAECDLEDAWAAVCRTIDVFRSTVQCLGLRIECDSRPDSPPTKWSFNFFVDENSVVERLGYAPLLIKVRLTQQRTNALPPVSFIDGVPVSDLRYIVADYASRAAKIDEIDARQQLNISRRAAVTMATRLEVTSDD